ncbi:unnamed protein product [Discosporangium mesarthrocarpum]
MCARTNGYPWDEMTSFRAAGGDHLEVLNWVWFNGCPWDENTCSGARGHLEVLKWARANDCPVDEKTCTEGTGGGHLEVVKCVRANDCPWDKAHVRKLHVEVT